MDRILAIGIIITFSVLFVLLGTVGTVNVYVFIIACLFVLGAAYCILEQTTLDMLTELLERVAKWMERK